MSQVVLFAQMEGSLSAGMTVTLEALLTVCAVSEINNSRMMLINVV